MFALDQSKQSHSFLNVSKVSATSSSVHHLNFFVLFSLSLLRCPREVCAYASPFEDSELVSTTPTSISTARPTSPMPTTSGPTTQMPTTSRPTTERPTTTEKPLTQKPVGPIRPPIHDQICIEADIKLHFFSIIGQEYCIETCQGKPMDLCNLYLCYCKTQWLSTRGF